MLAGLSAFGAISWTTHGEIGWGVASLPLLLLPLAFVARVERRTRILTIALVLVAFVQPELATARFTSPVVAALHPVNALLLAGLAWLVARGSRSELRRAGGDPA